MIKAVMFDFGGVLADEGFRKGLKAIAERNGLDPDTFYRTAMELIYQSGYVTGRSYESSYWAVLREKTGITGSDEELRQEILKRFVLREKIIRVVEKIKSSGFITAILSDQTNWLDEINEKKPFYHLFDFIFNSYKLKKSKRELSVFRDVTTAMGLKPDEVLFVDDNPANIKNASDTGLRSIHFTDVEGFNREIDDMLNIP